MAVVQDPWRFDRRDADNVKQFLTVPLTRINASKVLGLLKSGYQAVKIHQFSLQSESDSQTVYFYDAVTLVQIGQTWVFNAREGVVSPYSRAGVIVAQSIGHDIGINLANATY